MQVKLYSVDRTGADIAVEVADEFNAFVRGNVDDQEVKRATYYAAMKVIRGASMASEPISNAWRVEVSR